MIYKNDKLEKILKSMDRYPGRFLNKLSVLLSLHVPIIQESLDISSATLLQAILDFCFAQYKVIRWLKRDKDNVTIPQIRDDRRVVETDLDHVITMLILAQKIFIDKQYIALEQSLKKEFVLNGIFVHDGGEIDKVGDITHINEKVWIDSHDSQKESEHTNLISFWEKRAQGEELRKTLQKQVFDPYFAEEFRITYEGNFIKFLDRFQATKFGLQHIYPYEAIYKQKSTVEEYVAKYLLEQAYQLMRLLDKEAQEALRKFIMNNLSIDEVKESYHKALQLESLRPEEATMLFLAVKNMLSILYQVADAQVFLRDWKTLRETDEFSYIKQIQGL